MRAPTLALIALASLSTSPFLVASQASRCGADYATYRACGYVDDGSSPSLGDDSSFDSDTLPNIDFGDFNYGPNPSDILKNYHDTTMDIIENIGKRGLAARNAEADVIDRLMGLNKRDEEKTWFCCSSDAQCRATRGGGSSCFDEKSGDYILNDFSEGNAKDTPGLIQGMYRGAGGRITPVAGKGIRIAVSSIVLGWFLL